MEFAEGIVPDLCLRTTQTDDEQRRPREAESLRASIREGRRLKDLSTPAHAFPTCFSAFVHSDADTRREVQGPSQSIGADYFGDPKHQGWPQETAKRSLPMHSKNFYGDFCKLH